MAPPTSAGPSSKIPLLPGEKVARFAPATARFVTRAGAPGVLHLTDQRLIFRPDGDGRLLDARLGKVRGSTTFSPKILGFIPTRRALRVSIDNGRAGEEPWFVVEDADAWNAAIAQARAAATARMRDLAALLSAGEAAGRDAVSREAFGSFLAAERGFPGGFWHPGDEDSLLEVIGSRVADLALPADLLADPKLRAELRRIAQSEPGKSDADEDRARRRQIACVAARINTLAGPAASTRRLYAFADDIPGWEAHVPVWLHLNADERARLLALGVVNPPPAP
jgi:hypothetical protein